MASNRKELRLEVIRKALRYWDPIGVIEDKASGSGEADSEHDRYAIGLLGSIENGNDAYRLAHHLSGIRHGSMGIGSPKPSEREAGIASKLDAWRESGYCIEPESKFKRYAF